MRSTLPPLALLALGTALTGCRATTTASYASLETRASAPVVYEAEVQGRAVRMSDMATAWAPRDEDTPRSDIQIDVQTKILSMHADDAAGAFGYVSHGKQAILVDRMAAEKLIESLVAGGRAEAISAPRLSTIAGESATISVVNQIAYIKSFEVKAEDAILIADPNVGVADDGLMFAIEPSPPGADGSIDISLSLIHVALARPIDVLSTRIPGSTVPVEIQTPVTMSQRIDTVVRIAPDEALLLGGLETNEPGVFLFGMVTATEMRLEDVTEAGDDQ